MVDAIRQNGPVVHIRFQGKSWDIPVSELDLGGFPDDDQVRAAVASYLDVRAADLRFYAVERHANGNLTIRPQAVFG